MRLIYYLNLLLMIGINTQLLGQKRVDSIKELFSSRQEFTNLDTNLLDLGLNRHNEFHYKFGITEQLYSYKKNRYKNSIKLALLKAQVDNNKDVVLYYEIYRDYKEKIIYSSFLDSTNLERVISLFKKHGLSSINIHDEMTYLQSGSDLLGFACGFAASMPYHGKILLDILKEHDLSRLFEWLNSINPTKQAYGYLGIKIMIKQGVQLAPSQKKILDDFTNDIYGFNRYYYVRTCAGCTEWELYSLKELPETDFMKTMINLYSIEDKKTNYNAQ
jgi:hypothetical protein